MNNVGVNLAEFTDAVNDLDRAQARDFHDPNSPLVMGLMVDTNIQERLRLLDQRVAELERGLTTPTIHHHTLPQAFPDLPYDELYPRAGNIVDGRVVRDFIPNLSSMSASFNDYEELPGIREVLLSYFPGPPVRNDRTLALAEQIRQSGEINPLIVAVDAEGPYILEGGHRFDALQILGAHSFPAVVVLDLDDVEARASVIGRNLQPLADEAVKYDTFDEFEKAFIGEIKHGRYYHVTDDVNFTIDPLRGPRDMSSMADGSMTPGKLMVTSDLGNWASAYPERKYVAIIDMSQVPKEKYWQVSRGFGNEFWVDDPSKARVIRVISLNAAKQDSRRYHDALPQNRESLEAFYNVVKGGKVKARAQTAVLERVRTDFHPATPIAFSAARSVSRRPEMLTPYTPTKLATMRAFLSSGGGAGYALAADNDLVNVFNNSGTPGLGQMAVIDAIKRGADTLDAFAGFLPEYYARFGFMAYKTDPWDDAYAPPNWNYRTMDRPDIVYMRYEGGPRETIEQRIDTFPGYAYAFYVGSSRNQSPLGGPAMPTVWPGMGSSKQSQVGRGMGVYPRTRDNWEDGLRQTYGQAWLDRNHTRLDAEWEYVQELGGVGDSSYRAPGLQGRGMVNQPVSYPPLYHGTKIDYPHEDIKTGQRMFGIHLTTSIVAAGEYGKVTQYTLDPGAKVLDLSDGYDLWAWMDQQGIIDEDDKQNIDLENYVVSGQLYQYDISNKTHLADDVARTAKSLGYDVVKMPDNLHGEGDNIAWVVVNPQVLIAQTGRAKGEEA